MLISFGHGRNPETKEEEPSRRDRRDRTFSEAFSGSGCGLIRIWLRRFPNAEIFVTLNFHEFSLSVQVESGNEGSRV